LFGNTEKNEISRTSRKVLNVKGESMSLDIYITAKREVDIYERNVTYNLAKMYYKCIDKEKGFRKLDGMNCKEALPIVENAIRDMLVNADEYRKLNPENGWGSYEGLLATLQEMRNCCEANFDGIIRVY
jgi:hypothetical protein